MTGPGVLRWTVLPACLFVAGCGSAFTGSTPSSGGARSGGSAGQPGSGGSGGNGGSADRDGGSGTGGIGGQGAAGGASGSGGAGGAACTDPGPEPNNSEADATSACGSASSCEITDCDSDGSTAFGGPLEPIKGVLSPNDVDVFSFQGKDTFGCSVDPTIKTQQSGFRMCVFVTCKQGTEQLNSCSSGSKAVGPGGQSGCCTSAPGQVALNYSCASGPGSDESASVFIVVDQATSCTPYTIDYHF